MSDNTQKYIAHISFILVIRSEHDWAHSFLPQYFQEKNQTVTRKKTKRNFKKEKEKKSNAVLVAEVLDQNLK